MNTKDPSHKTGVFQHFKHIISADKFLVFMKLAPRVIVFRPYC